MRRIGLLAMLGYIGCVVAANWAVQHYGIVNVGFGLMAPAAVYFVGIAFTLRDIVHRSLGWQAAVVAILVGTAVSFLIAPQFARASAAAFLFSEGADLAVYSPLRRRGWLRAVTASNIVGLVVDSVIFLWLAFRSFEFLPGQIVGKAWMTLAAIVVLALVRRARPAEPALA